MNQKELTQTFMMISYILKTIKMSEPSQTAPLYFHAWIIPQNKAIAALLVLTKQMLNISNLLISLIRGLSLFFANVTRFIQNSIFQMH